MQVNVTKIVLYVLLTLAAVYCSRQFVARYSLLMSTEVDSGAYAIEGNGRPTLPVVVSPETNVVEGNPGGNEGEYPVESVESGSGGSSTGANTAVASNLVSTPSAADPDPMASVPLTKGGFDRGQAPDTSGIGLYAVAMFGVLIALGVLAAHDVSTFMAQRAHKLLHNEEGEGIVDVDYDHAEQVWADGDHLGAIRLMREYLEKNPREVHVMVRIAEIYEKDLGNFLAAALEYEEILKHKLPAERWGWSAIHLVNLYYGKLDKPAQGLVGLLAGDEAVAGEDAPGVGVDDEAVVGAGVEEDAVGGFAADAVDGQQSFPHRLRFAGKHAFE
jgi:hypothetical protein